MLSGCDGCWTFHLLEGLKSIGLVQGKMVACFARGANADIEQLISLQNVGCEGGVEVPGYALVACGALG